MKKINDIMKKRFRFRGPYLYDEDKIIGSIKDNRTIDEIEDILNGLNSIILYYIKGIFFAIIVSMFFVFITSFLFVY